MQEYRKATATGAALTRTTGVELSPCNAIAAGFERDAARVFGI
jgi:hypothetical protein